MNEWISTKEHLPPLCKRVQIRDDSGEEHFARLSYFVGDGPPDEDTFCDWYGDDGVLLATKDSATFWRDVEPV